MPREAEESVGPAQLQRAGPWFLYNGRGPESGDSPNRPRRDLATQPACDRWCTGTASLVYTPHGLWNKGRYANETAPVTSEIPHHKAGCAGEHRVEALVHETIGVAIALPRHP